MDSCVAIHGDPQAKRNSIKLYASCSTFIAVCLTAYCQQPCGFAELQQQHLLRQRLQTQQSRHDSLLVYMHDCAYNSMNVYFSCSKSIAICLAAHCQQLYGSVELQQQHLLQQKLQTQQPPHDSLLVCMAVHSQL